MPASTEDQEALFQALIHKISKTEDPARLRDATLAALGLALCRPSDQATRTELSDKVDAILSPLAGATPQQVHLAARQCLAVLRIARDRRQARPPGGAARHPPPRRRNAASSRSSHHHAAAARALTIAGGGTVLVGALLWMWGLTVHPAPAPEMIEAQRLAEQIIAAAQTVPPPTHQFGGPLRRISQDGQATVVVAELVPPHACAVAGWALLRKGTLTINGVTPSRMSAARVTELCNQGPSLASLRWVPKTP